MTDMSCHWKVERTWISGLCQRCCSVQNFLIRRHGTALLSPWGLGAYMVLWPLLVVLPLESPGMRSHIHFMPDTHTWPCSLNLI